MYFLRTRSLLHVPVSSSVVQCSTFLQLQPGTLYFNISYPNLSGLELQLVVLGEPSSEGTRQECGPENGQYIGESAVEALLPPRPCDAGGRSRAWSTDPVTPRQAAGAASTCRSCFDGRACRTQGAAVSASR
eukprot:366336-Chlamydomonas_euryale.AAC.27